MKYCNIIIYTILLVIAKINFSFAKADGIKYIKKYYAYISKSGQAILHDNFALASRFFDSAFQYTEYPFQTDLSNAIFCQLRTDSPDTIKVIHYFTQLRNKDIDLNERYINNQEYVYYKEQASLQPRNSRQSNAMTALMTKAIEDDQTIRNQALEKYKHIYIPQTYRQINEVDARCYNKLLLVMKESLSKKIPLEELIGVENCIHFYTILSHNATLWGRFDNNPLKRLVLLGLIDNRQYAAFVDKSKSTKNDNEFYNKDNPNLKKLHLWSGYGTSMGTYIQTDKTSLILVPNNSKLKEINSNRKEIFLSDWKAEIKLRIKIFYAKNGLQFPYCNIINFPDSFLHDEIKAGDGYDKKIIYNGQGILDFD